MSLQWVYFYAWNKKVVPFLIVSSDDDRKNGAIQKIVFSIALNRSYTLPDVSKATTMLCNNKLIVFYTNLWALLICTAW